MRLFMLELKRVLKTRLTAILILAALVLSAIMAYLPVTFVYWNYLDENGVVVKLDGAEALAYKKVAQEKITGEITTEMVRDALTHYQAVINSYDVKDPYELPSGVYGSELLPIMPLLDGVREASADAKTGMAPNLMEVNAQGIDDFYALCDTHLVNLMHQEQSDYPVAQKDALARYSEVQTPYVYYPGYSTDAVDYQVLVGFLILAICAVLAAGVFTDDYQTGADDILRCTKNGRAKLAIVKMAAALLISACLMSVTSVIYVLLSNSFFGWESTKTSIQMLYSIVNLTNWNVADLQVFIAVTGLVAVLATVCAVLFMSSKCSSMAVAVASALGLCVLPFIIYLAVPKGLGEWLNMLIPSSGAGLTTSFCMAVIDFVYFNIGDFAIWQPYAMLGACLIEIPLFIGLAMHAYLHHHAK